MVDGKFFPKKQVNSKKFVMGFFVFFSFPSFKSHDLHHTTKANWTVPATTSQLVVSYGIDIIYADINIYSEANKWKEFLLQVLTGAERVVDYVGRIICVLTLNAEGFPPTRRISLFGCIAFLAIGMSRIPENLFTQQNLLIPHFSALKFRIINCTVGSWRGYMYGFMQVVPDCRTTTRKNRQRNQELLEHSA